MAHRSRTAAGSQAESTSPKICASCGREIEWRAKWARDWDAVRFCSEACRRRGVTDADRVLEAGILQLLSDAASVDAEDAARRLCGDDWRAQLEPVRRAGRRLVAAGELEFVQGGRVVDPSTARGSVLFRRVRT